MLIESEHSNSSDEYERKKSVIREMRVLRGGENGRGSEMQFLFRIRMQMKIENFFN